MGLAIVRRVVIRAALATVCAALPVAIGSAANFLTTAPRTISLLFEPFSMLLLPGLFASLFIAGPHDYSPGIVVIASFLFYAAVFYLVLLRRTSNP